MKMKTIGLIGGTGWISSLEYYKQLNEKINHKLGGLQFARCILYSLNYGDLDELNRRKDLEGTYALLLDAAEKLAYSKVDGIAICANTLHRFADRLGAEIGLPIIHIADATARQIQKLGYTCVGLLGTRQTMEEDFYRKRLKLKDIETIIPCEGERLFIQQAIVDELLKSEFKTETRNRFKEIIDSLHMKGAEAIVLGCTEIPLLISQADTDLPVINTLDIHTDAIIDYMLALGIP
jgi:aspartate racemase